MFVLGALLTKSGFLSVAFCREATRFNYWLGMPVLVFQVFSKALPLDNRISFFLTLFIFIIGLAVVCTCLAVILFRTLPPLAGIFPLKRYHDVLVFLALPIVLALPDRDLGLVIGTHPAAIILILLLHHALDIGRQTTDSAATRQAFRSPWLHMVVSPPLWFLLGIGLYLTAGWSVPDAIDGTFRMIVIMIIPFGALSLGGVYAERPWSRFQR